MRWDGDEDAMMMGWGRLSAFVRLGRPKFLIGGFCFYGLGAVVAVQGGAAVDWRSFGLGQLAITVIQLMTHYANDYFDFAADVANRTPTDFSGGSRVLPAGELSPRVAHTTAVVLALLGVALALSIAFLVPGGSRGWRVASFLLLAEALAWAYSAPPFALHARGLGELTTAVIVTGLTPFAGYLLQAGGEGTIANLHLQHTERVLWLALVPLAALQFNMLLTIEFPDATGDAAVGKRTLVVRLGPHVAAVLSRLLLIGVYGGLPLWVWLGLPPAVAFACALGFPLAALQFWRLGLGQWADPARWQSLALGAVALLMMTSIAELAAFAWLLRRAP